jgi:hypothetical protein
MKPLPCVAATAVLVLVGAVVQAAPPQTVYRCGPDGRIYSQTPCADGKALSVDDPRSASQQKAGRDAEQARKLAEERRQREAAAKEQQAAGFKTAPVADAASAPQRKPKPKPKPKPEPKGGAANTDTPMSAPMRVPAQGTASK